MATAPQALLVALDLMRVPALAPALRRQVLPHGMLEVIRIAGGCRRTCREAAHATGKPPEMIKEAAVFYLQQALLFPEADSYRVLGVAPDAPQEKMREHMLWLMRWLHPDHNASNWETVFAGRVLEAWSDLKSPSRRAHYDRLRRQTRTAPPSSPRLRQRARRSRAAVLPLVAIPLEASQPRRRRRLVTWALALFVGLVTCLTPWPNIEIGSQDQASSQADNALAEAHKRAPAWQRGMMAVQE